MSTAAQTLEAELSHALGAHVRSGFSRAAGGAFTGAGRYDTDRGPIFVKAGPPAAYAMFAAEAAGLAALADTEALRTPRVLAVRKCARGAFIALEWIPLGAPTRSCEAVLGEQLAWQHRTTQPHFGWTRDNTIGPTPQINTPSADWVIFLRDRRLRYQLELARGAGIDPDAYERGLILCESLGAFFSDYRPSASLLHGDLWGGNWGSDSDGLPVVFDPAVYYGDREADIAMTRLFGGFGAAFYAAYHSTWALDAGAPVRTTLYNLYHVLNHFNLFGAAYRAQASAMIDQLLAEVGR